LLSARPRFWRPLAGAELFACADRPRLVAAVTAFLTRADANGFNRTNSLQSSKAADVAEKGP
jgi:hypothetical protein